jgi:hypothetical protein
MVGSVSVLLARAVTAHVGALDRGWEGRSEIVRTSRSPFSAPENDQNLVKRRSGTSKTRPPTPLPSAPAPRHCSHPASSSSTSLLPGASRWPRASRTRSVVPRPPIRQRFDRDRPPVWLRLGSKDGGCGGRIGFCGGQGGGVPGGHAKAGGPAVQAEPGRQGVRPLLSRRCGGGSFVAVQEGAVAGRAGVRLLLYRRRKWGDQGLRRRRRSFPHWEPAAQGTILQLTLCSSLLRHREVRIGPADVFSCRISSLLSPVLP